MPSFASIVINDGEGTPVAHTFSPAKLQSMAGGVVLATFEDRAGGVIVGYHRLRAESLPPTANGIYRQRVTIEYATLETLSNNTSSGINPAPTLAYTTKAELTLFAPRRGTKQERKNARVLMTNALANTGVISFLEDLEAYY